MVSSRICMDHVEGHCLERFGSTADAFRGEANVPVDT
jgi:hypothetical protein